MSDLPRGAGRRGRGTVGLKTLIAGCALAFTGCVERPDPPPSGDPAETAVALPAATAGGIAQPIRFEDATAEAGIVFKHVNGATGRKFMPETLGAGVCVFDYDGDGLQDIYFVQSGRLPGFEPAGALSPALFRNLGHGRFQDVTAAAGLAADGPYAFGCVAGDIDADGDRDLYVTAYGPNRLYRNRGDGRFEDATAAAGVAGDLWSTGAALADYDGDGDLDLYVANYVDYDLAVDDYCGENRPGYRTVCHPNNYDSQPDALYRNRGDGRFDDVSAAAGIIDRTGKGLGVVFGDLDGDGDEDIYVANDDTPNFLFRNDGDGRFTEIGELAGVALSEDGVPQAGMGVAMGDFDRDGRPDLFVTNLSEETNEMYRNHGDGSFSHATFAAGLGGTSLLDLGFGTFFFDPDSDGDLDLFVANGHIIDNIALFSDTVTFEQPPRLYRNDGQGHFAPVGEEGGAPFGRRYVGRGAAWFDYDDDGDVDVLMSQNDRTAVLLRNVGAGGGAWVTFSLVGLPPNRDAIGARVTIETVGPGRLRQTAQVRAGSSYLSQGDRRLHFGLGEVESIASVVVRWPGPDRFEEKFEVSGVRRFVTLRQGTGRRLERRSVQ